MPINQLLDKIIDDLALGVARHWNDARGTKLMPAWSDIKPSAFPKSLPFIWAWKYDVAKNEFTGRLAGDFIIEALGSNPHGREAHDVFRDKGAETFIALGGRVVGEPCFYYGSGAILAAAGRAVVGERIAMPLSTDGETADGILGITVYDRPRGPAGDGYPEADVNEFIEL